MIFRASTARKLRIARVSGLLFIGICLVAIALNIALPHGSSAAAEPIVVHPEADTHVKKSEPNRNFGGASHFDADASPLVTSFVRFQVSGVGSGSIAQARLRLFVYDASSRAGLKVFSTTSDWDEMTTTWNRQPAKGPQVADLAPIAMKAGTWIEVDLGQAVTGDGSYSFALTTDSADQIGFRSRTTTAAAQLVLTPRADSPTPTPAPTQPPPPAPDPSIHPMGCRPGEVFADTQDWWTNPDASKDHGHLHVSVCFPHNQVLSGKVTFRVRTVMHDNPGTLTRLQVGILGPKVAGAPACGEGLVCATIDPPRTCPQETCQWWDEITVDTAWHAHDGWQQFRFKGYVKEPDGTEMIVSNGMHAYLQNGHPRQDTTYVPSHLIARGWYTDAGYANATIVNPPTGPVAGVWEPEVRLDDGAGGLPVVAHYVALDTDFHNGNPGVPIASGAGSYRGRVRIDTTQLSNGWHRLFLKTDALHSASGSTNSGVLAIMFEVRN